jgi:hypothetical protein
MNLRTTSFACVVSYLLVGAVRVEIPAKSIIVLSEVEK